MSNEITTVGNMGIVMTDALQTILTQKTPLEDVRFRKGPGGRQFPYTDTAFVIRTLNNAFAWDWDFEADHEEILYIYPDGIQKPYEVRCRGKLTVRIEGKSIVKMQYGSQPLELKQNSQDTPVSLGDAFKGAASDALKKCASLLGIALDLYDSDSAINENPAKAQQAQQQQKHNKPTQSVVVEQPTANGQAAPTTESKPAKPYKFPSTAAESFFKEIEVDTDNYFEGNGFRFVNAMEKLSLNFGAIITNADKRTEAKSALNDYARMRRAEKEAA